VVRREPPGGALSLVKFVDMYTYIYIYIDIAIGQLWLIYIYTHIFI
jgi:hypothetical protein